MVRKQLADLARPYYKKYQTRLKAITRDEWVGMEEEQKFTSLILDTLQVPQTPHNCKRLYDLCSQGIEIENLLEDLDTFVDLRKLNEAQFRESVNKYQTVRNYHESDRFGLPGAICALVGYPIGFHFYNLGLIWFWLQGEIGFEALKLGLAVEEEGQTPFLLKRIQDEYRNDLPGILKTVMVFSQDRKLKDEVFSYFRDRGIRFLMVDPDQKSLSSLGMFCEKNSVDLVIADAAHLSGIKKSLEFLAPVADEMEHSSPITVIAINSDHAGSASIHFSRTEEEDGLRTVVLDRPQRFGIIETIEQECHRMNTRLGLFAA